MIKNSKGQLDEISPIGILGGLIGGALGVVIARRMYGGLLITIMSFLICAIACYFIASKIGE